MYILFASSQSKNSGGNYNPYAIDSFILPEIFEHRQQIVKLYEQFIHDNPIDEVSTWFGLKDKNETKKNIYYLTRQPTMKAIQRYTGVAYDAIDYENLDKKSRTYIDHKVVIFSDLFGAVMAKDFIPNYRYKQGAKLPNIDVAKYYKKHLKNSLYEILGDEILDLRAGYYDKYYKPIASVITYKFIKNGKLVSHWAKYYRGKLLKDIAYNSIENFAMLMKFDIPYLKTIDIQTKKNLKTIVVEVL